MADPAMPYLIVHLSLGLLWALLAGWLWWQPERALLRMQIWLAALLSALAPRLLFESGHWPDLSKKGEIAIIGLSLLMAMLPRHMAGRLAALALGALWIVLGASSLRHAVPLTPPMAVKAMLLGLLVMLLPRAATGPGRQGTILGLLLITAAVALHGDLLRP